MTNAETKLKEHTGTIGNFQREPQKPIEIKPPQELPKKTEKGESYLIKQLKRIP